MNDQLEFAIGEEVIVHKRNHGFFMGLCRGSKTMAWIDMPGYAVPQQVNLLQLDHIPKNPIKALTIAALGLLDRYLDLVNSGDAGSWDPEEDIEVIAVRAALSDAEEELREREQAQSTPSSGTPG